MPLPKPVPESRIGAAGVTAAILLVLTLGGRLPAEPSSHAGMKEYRLDGATVWLGQPIEVTKQIGWGMQWAHSQAEPSWSFIHLTPYMDRFPNGELIVTYAMDPDTQVNPICLSAYQISADQGRTWGRRVTAILNHNPLIFLPKKDDALLGVPCEFTSLSDQDPTTYVAPAYLFKHGGKEMTLIPDGVRIVDWKWPVATNPGVQPENLWHVGITLTGSAVQVGKRILATGHSFSRGSKPGERLFHNVLFSSEDGGYTWRYYSTIADYDPAFRGQSHYEGPNETYMIRLADGDLMTIFRVGGGEQWKLRRNYSHDGGLTWSQPDVLPAWSVRPAVLRLSNGTIALTTGRPGIYLWLATDARAAKWQSIDLLAYHNEWAPNPSLKIGWFLRPDGRKTYQTTSYTGLVETSPNHLLMVYDRDPERAPTGPDDLSHVYVLPIEIERR